MIKRLRSKSGETLIETLIAMLIVTIAMVMLAGSIVSAAKVNRSSKNLETDFKVSNVSSFSTVTIRHNDGTTTNIDVDVHQHDGKYKYTYYETK